jgi:hypothetical protein
MYSAIFEQNEKSEYTKISPHILVGVFNSNKSVITSRNHLFLFNLLSKALSFSVVKKN